jgi:uncharacterized protein
MPPTLEPVRQLLVDIAKSLVDNPEFVQVRALEAAAMTVFELRTHPSDSGKVIGRQGRLVDAMRIILSAAGAKAHTRFRLEVFDSKTRESAAAGVGT